MDRDGAYTAKRGRNPGTRVGKTGGPPSREEGAPISRSPEVRKTKLSLQPIMLCARIGHLKEKITAKLIRRNVK